MARRAFRRAFPLAMLVSMAKGKETTMDFTKDELDHIYTDGDGRTITLRQMLSEIDQDDLPQDSEDLHWLLWSFGAAPISSESL